MPSYIITSYKTSAGKYVVTLGKGIHKSCIIANRKLGSNGAQLAKRFAEYDNNKFGISVLSVQHFACDADAIAYCKSTEEYINN